MVLSASAALAGFASSKPAWAQENSKSAASYALIRAFFIAHNKGHWGTMNDLLSEDVRLRSNLGLLSGGMLLDRASVLGFYEKRYKQSKITMHLDESAFATSSGYISTLSRGEAASDCRGVWCASVPTYSHIFYLRLMEREGALINASISDITEVDLMSVGLCPA